MHPTTEIQHPRNKTWLTFALSCGLVFAVLVLLSGAHIILEQNSSFEEALKARARAHFANIVYTRSWIARHGGVFVLKKPETVSNIYLETPDMIGADGTVYTLKNPALVTREISRIADLHDDFSYAITSLKPINPANIADNFETKALHSFHEGKKELWEITPKSDKVFLRYMAPLYVEESCLNCHQQQGYKLGDVRGGISVTFDITENQHAFDSQRTLFYLIGAGGVFVAFFLFYILIVRLMRKLEASHKAMQQMAITDKLTGLHNRHHLMTRFNEEFERAKRYNQPLACLILDIDHFKNINDTYGHLTGDTVLREIAQTLRNSLRTTDILGRYGGEEFVVLLPHTTQEQAELLGRRLLEAVEHRAITTGADQIVTVTISLGCSVFTPDATELFTPENLLQTADTRLLRAKCEGRNRGIYANAPLT